MRIIIKNIVCDRCCRAVQGVFHRLSIPLECVAMGYVDTVSDLSNEELELLNEELLALGFEILKDKNEQLIERIKTIIIGQARLEDAPTIKLSVLLSEELNVDYKSMSQLFSKLEGKTIEKYYLTQRTEFIKELIDYNELTISEIAYKLGYSSVAHLSTQFKQTTGMTPTQYKNDHNQERLALDAL